MTPKTQPIQVPPDLVARTITDMQPGEHGYIPSQAVLTSLDWTMWVNGTHLVTEEPEGHYRIRIMRTGEGVRITKRHVPPQRPKGRAVFSTFPKSDQLPIVGFIEE